MKHVIVLESDRAARADIADFLSSQSVRTTRIDDGQHLRRILAREIVDVVLIEVKSNEDIELVREVATLTDAPILILSGNLVAEDEKVRGLEAGANDYICRPFGYRELSARVAVALRERTGPRIERVRRSYKFGDNELSVQQRTVTRSGLEDVKLTTAEFNLLTAFLSTPRQALTREQLLAASRIHSGEIVDRSLDALILRLRRKIEKDPANPQLIKTQRGSGYLFDCDVKVEERLRLKR